MALDMLMGLIFNSFRRRKKTRIRVEERIGFCAFNCRDVKYKNLVMTAAGDSAVLIDFGCCRAASLVLFDYFVQI